MRINEEKTTDKINWKIQNNVIVIKSHSFFIMFLLLMWCYNLTDDKMMNSLVNERKPSLE